jgi:hypothetical protein
MAMKIHGLLGWWYLTTSLYKHHNPKDHNFKLTSKSDKTNFMKFLTNNKPITKTHVTMI